MKLLSQRWLLCNFSHTFFFFCFCFLSLSFSLCLHYCSLSGTPSPSVYHTHTNTFSSLLHMLPFTLMLSVSLNLSLSLFFQPVSNFLTLLFSPTSLSISLSLPLKLYPPCSPEQTMRPSWPVSNSLAAADELGSFASQTFPASLCTSHTHMHSQTHTLSYANLNRGFLLDLCT